MQIDLNKNDEQENYFCWLQDNFSEKILQYEINSLNKDFSITTEAESILKG